MISFHENTHDISVSYFFRQVNFVIMSFFALKITTRCKRKFYNKLTRYLAVFVSVFVSVFVFIIAVFWFGGGELSEDDSAFFSCYFLYFLVGVWVFVFLIGEGENRIKPECRELLMFFALSGVVCNLIMTAVATGGFVSMVFEQNYRCSIYVDSWCGFVWAINESYSTGW